jgi:uncharacterized protein
MWIGYEFHHQAISSICIGIDNAHAQPMFAQILDGSLLMTMGVMEEGLPVGDEELQVANLRAIQRGKIDLTDDAVGNCEPHATGGGIRCPNYVLRAVGPTRGYPRPASSYGQSFERCHTTLVYDSLIVLAIADSERLKMKISDFPALGFGIGLRPCHYAQVLEQHPAMEWFEVISENFMVDGGRPLEVLAGVRSHYPIVMHGVSLSLGSTDPLNRFYLKQLTALIQQFEPAWVSDHLCWTGIGGHNLHDLLPLPYTEEAVRHVSARIRQVQQILERTILIENVSSYIEFRSSQLSEWAFLSAIAEEADCGILLDINNIFVNAFNHGFDAVSYIDSVPARRVVQFHLAGHSDHGSYLLDTHDHEIRPEVWALYEHAIRRFGPVPTLIEWDDAVPKFEALAGIAEEARTRCRKVHGAT